MSKILVRHWHSGKYVACTWAELIEQVTDESAMYVNGSMEQTNAKLEGTGKLLSKIVELLIEHEAIPEDVVFETLVGHRAKGDEPEYKLVPKE